MVSILLRFIILILILWLIRRVLARFFSPSRAGQQQGNQVASPNNMVKDPVCGMYMDARLAIRMEERKEVIFFCSEDCRNKYLAGSTESTGAPNSAA